MLQHSVASVCCSVLQCVAVCCIEAGQAKKVMTCCNIVLLVHVAVCCSMLQYVAVRLGRP